MKLFDNLERVSSSPKFIRRSMSPIDYVNSESFKARHKKAEIKVDFGFVKEKKLEKSSTKKRDFFALRTSMQKTEPSCTNTN